ncbi:MULTISPECIES: hypothetical protein [unclassified Brevibacterium]|jgi:uncharacterized membrane protein|uniref:hypothetical protein n=1 Tax=unclassified Brevibacterium TaxID=2614124 RepID=UPI001080A850|nr:hypothetical protein [Brevibacterium sp. S111]TGD12544.1 hypothetical protein EB836_05655 [Brevibacterium sp. S111]
MRKSGFAVDGTIKLVLAVLGAVFSNGLAHFFLSPRWLVITAMVLLFLSAATQISYAVSKGEKRYLKYPMIFDALIILAIVIGLVLAAAANPAGAWILFGLVIVGSLGIAVVFTTGENGPRFND